MSYVEIPKIERSHLCPSLVHLRSALSTLPITIAYHGVRRAWVEDKVLWLSSVFAIGSAATVFAPMQ